LRSPWCFLGPQTAAPYTRIHDQDLGYVFGHSPFAGKTRISVEEKQNAGRAKQPEMAISLSPKGQALLLSGQTDIEVKGG